MNAQGSGVFDDRRTSRLSNLLHYRTIFPAAIILASSSLAGSYEVELLFEHPEEASLITPSPYPTYQVRVCVEDVFCMEQETTCPMDEVCSVEVDVPNDCNINIAVGRDGLWSGPSNSKRIYNAEGAMDADKDGAVTSLDFSVFFEQFSKSQSN